MLLGAKIRIRTRTSLLLLVAGLLAFGAAGEAWAGPGTGWDTGACVNPVSIGKLAILPVNAGVGYTTNTCLAAQATTPNVSQVQLFVNGADPGPASTHWPAGCGWTSDCAYQYGKALGADDAARIAASISGRYFVWLDTEQTNTWAKPADSADYATLNARAFQGLADGLTASSTTVSGVGVYTTKADWLAIAGTASLDSMPLWSGSAGTTVSQAQRNCTLVDGDVGAGITGGITAITQYDAGGRDGDVVCAPLAVAPRTTTEGKGIRLVGTALPDTVVAVTWRQTDGRTTTTPVRSDELGQWTATFPKARYAMTVTVRALDSSTAGTIQPTPVVTGSTVAARTASGGCALRTRGTMTPVWPGMQVALNVDGHPKKLTIKTSTTRATWDATVPVSCGVHKASIGTNGHGKGNALYTAKLTTTAKAIRTR